MADAYTLKKLTDVEDSAPWFGFEEVQEARFATEDLGGRGAPSRLVDRLSVPFSVRS